jgi:hypothetical protein
MTPHDKVVEMCGDFEAKSKEDLAIRAERQRERANKWMKRCELLEKQLAEQKNDDELRIAAMVSEAQKISEISNSKIESIKKELFDTRQEMRKLHGEKIDAYSRGHKEGREYAEKQYAREIRIGRREIANRRKKRVNEKIYELLCDIYDIETEMDKNNDLLDWVRRAIKRRIDAPNHVDVVVLDGSKKRENSQPKLVGRSGYFTTLSGKTIVNHPGAYGWRTVYHCSTEHVEVGCNWIRKNICFLAKSEAELRVK